MRWKEAAAELGTATLVSGLKALQGTMKKRDFKRLVATTAAQVLAVHPGVKKGKARRWARKVTGTRPAKSVGVKKVVQAAGAAAVTVGAGRLAARLADRPAVRRRGRAMKEAVEEKVAPESTDSDKA
jgi:hypothetical protein